MTESTTGELPDVTYIDGQITLWVPGGKVTDVGVVNLERKIRDAAVEIMTYFMAGYPLDLRHNLLDLHFDKVREVYTDREDGEEYVREERRPVDRREFISG